MSLNESIVEDAALEWFGEQTHHARTLTRLCVWKGYFTIGNWHYDGTITESTQL